MKLARSVRLGAWILIGLNLLMAFGSIRVFTRMTPAIEVIIDQNGKSLQACEEMLASLAASRPVGFAEAMQRAQNNLTEKGEAEALREITAHYNAALQGDAAAREQIVDAIVRLGTINRIAMDRADRKARQYGTAGAWGIVFMASALFLIGMLFLRGLAKTLVNPLEEIYAVSIARLNGDLIRRCTGKDLPKDVRHLYDHLNELLDNSTSKPDV